MIDGLVNKLFDLKLQAALLKFRLGKADLADLMLIGDHIPDRKKCNAFVFLEYMKINKSIFFPEESE